MLFGNVVFGCETDAEGVLGCDCQDFYFEVGKAGVGLKWIFGSDDLLL